MNSFNLLTGIDRQKLGKYGLNADQINRVYRGLFVYSVGFFELLKKCAAHTQNKGTLVSTIWRVYAILIEYCCKTDYNMVISEVSRDFQTKIAVLEKQIEVAKASYSEKEKAMMEEREFLKTEYDSMNKKTEQYIKHISKLNEYITDLRDRNDEEIKIRKQFEAKLNELHSIGRDQEVKYFRAINEIDELIQKLENIEKNSLDYREETIGLRRDKIYLETQVINLESKRKTLTKENIHLNRLLNQKEKRIEELEKEVCSIKHSNNQISKQLNEFKIKSEVANMKIEKFADEIRDTKQKLDSEISSNKVLTKDNEQIQMKYDIV